MRSDISKGHASGRPQHYVAPWYLAYAILGLITSGMLPFLMPLMVMSTTSEPGRVAYVIGAYNFGLLAAPLLGKLAQRYKLSARYSSAVLLRWPSVSAPPRKLRLLPIGFLSPCCVVSARALWPRSRRCSSSISPRKTNGTRVSDGCRVSAEAVSWPGSSSQD